MKATDYCVRVFDGTHDTPKQTKKGFKLITSKNILNKTLNLDDAYFISELDYNNINKRSKVKQWDILFSMIGTVGNVYLEQNKDISYAIKNMGVFSCEDEKKALWLYYYLQSPYFKQYLDSFLSGAVQKFVPLDFLRNIDIPDWTEDSIRICSILSTLDRKISLNRSINAELERMAKEIYDYWFVQFDFPDENGRPYKSFGGKMVYNETLKREIPEGWEVKNIGNEALIRRGSIITEKETNIGNIKVVAAGINYSYLHNQSNRKPNIITISTSGANAGYMNFWREPIYASDCITVECENDVNTLICYYNLWHYREIMLRSACGSAQPHVYPYHIEPLPFIKATDSIIKKFGDVITPINNDIANNEKEIEELSALRNELLPLLMTGQVRVK